MRGKSRKELGGGERGKGGKGGRKRKRKRKWERWREKVDKERPFLNKQVLTAPLLFD